MCNTHEPPTSSKKLSSDLEKIVRTKWSSVGDTTRRAKRVVEHGDRANEVFLGPIHHGSICAFLPGYRDFFGEANVAIQSVATFMPGIRIAIATSPANFHLFNR